jgi:hypothetical protein
VRAGEALTAKAPRRPEKNVPGPHSDEVAVHVHSHAELVGENCLVVARSGRMAMTTATTADVLAIVAKS